MRRFLPAFFLLFLCACPLFLSAQSDLYQFSRLSIDNGLSNNRVTCIYKDAKGFMWFGTKSGLNRYDGYRFKVFKHNINNPGTIDDDYIASIEKAPDSKLWIKTRKGFNIYDPLSETFDHNIKAALGSYQIPDSLISCIKIDKKGNFWFTHLNKGIYVYNTQTAKLTHLIADPKKKTSIHPGYGVAIQEDGIGNMWVVYDDGVLDRINCSSFKVTLRNYDINKLYPLKKVDYRLYVDQQNDAWAYAPFCGNGAFFIGHNNEFMHLGKSVGNVKLSSDIVFDVLQDDKGLVWVAMDHGGINLIDKKPFKVIQMITNRPDDNRSLSQDCIVSLFKDDANIIWLGTFKKGASYYHPDIIKFPLYRHQSFLSNGLGFDDMNKFVEDKQGNIWVGSNGGGLIYFNRKTGNFTTYLHDSKNPNSLSNNVIASLYLDHEQKLWIGTYFGGLDRFDGKTFAHYKHSAADSKTIADNSIWEILEDSKNRLWIGTLTAGLDLFDRKQNVFYHYPVGAKNSVPHQYISGLAEDNKGNIWVATYNGVAVLQNNTNKFIYYKHIEADKQSLANDNISNIMVDSRHFVWMATNEGLSMFNPQTGKFTNFRQADGLPDNAVLTVVEDNVHNLWMSTLNGISNLSISAKKGGGFKYSFKNYDQTDGLQAKEFNEDAALHTRNNELIFGGANGFNMFKPENIKSAKEKPVLLLTDFQLFNESLRSGQKVNGHVVLKQSITETKEITLTHNENVFSIEFTAINFFNPDKIKQAYMLDGFDKGWIIADNKIRKASYTNLDPGVYMFRLKAAGEDGIWADKQLALKITVLPPIWRTIWAYILYALIILGALLYIRNRGIKKLKANFALQQERQEAKQMHELDLMKIKFFTNVSHEFRTPLSLILAPVDRLLKKGGDEEMNKHLQMINRNGKRLLNLVNQLLDFRKMEVHELKLNTRNDDIVKFIEEAASSFSDIAECKQITLTVCSQIPSLNTAFDPDKVERILFNLLSNAFKFTHDGGIITVKLSYQDNEGAAMVKIEVIDNGIGIPEEKVDRIFERFFQHDMQGSMVNQGSGIGLAITKEFVSLHNGTITVKSEINKGCCFTVFFPVTSNPVLQDTVNAEFATLGVTQHKAFSNEKNRLQTPTEQQKNSKKSLILLIEDNDDFRFYLKDNLKEHYLVEEASNGLDGWQKVLSLHPNLVVSDISMPQMNGIDLCHKIKNDNRTKHIPVVLLTALTGQDEQLKGLETGASDYLTKPFNFEILLSKIKNLLNQQLVLKKTYQKQLDISSAISGADSNDEKFMVDIIKIIEKKMHDSNFSVEELSSDMAMNRVTLYRKALLMTERTPVEFIKLIRLKKSAQLLQSSHLNIAEIAYKVGFNNPKYFAKSFKQEFGQLPTYYRNAANKNKEELQTVK